MTYSNKNGFTLTELIVVITIIAILSVIVFLYFQGYTRDARNSQRMEDVASMTKGLELLGVRTDDFPMPDYGSGITFSGSVVWTQGVYGESVARQVKELTPKPVDPLYGVEYTYSVTHNRREIEVGAVLEDDGNFLIGFNQTNPIIDSVNANTSTTDINLISYVSGNYNGMVIRDDIGGRIYILAVPTIISGDISGISTEPGYDANNSIRMLKNRFAYKDAKNIPGSYAVKGFTTWKLGNWDYDIAKDDGIVVFSGTSVPNDGTGYILFAQEVARAYSGSAVAIKAPFNKIIAADDGEKKSYGEAIICSVLGGRGVNGKPCSSASVSIVSAPVEIPPTENPESCTLEPVIEHANGSLVEGICQPVCEENYTLSTTPLYHNSGDIIYDSDGYPVSTYNGGEPILDSNGNQENQYSCDPSQVSIDCDAPPIENTRWMTSSSYTQTWNGSAWDPIEASIYDPTGINTSYCGYSCAIEYTYSGGVCIAPTLLTNVASIGVGGNNSCAVISGGTVKCWGENNAGQLGNGVTTDSNTPNAVPVQVTGITNATAVSVGYNNSCARLSDGTLKCWGDGYWGQLGNGNSGASAGSLVPVFVRNIANTASLNNAISVSIGQGSACAVLSDSTVACWGENNNGQLGNGNYVNSAIPVLVRDATNTPITNVASVSVGAAGTVCAVLINGNMDCWGYGLYGLLGNGTNTKSNQAVTASLGGSIAKSVSVGMSHACVLLSDNTVKCWGSGANGTLGNGTYTESHVPVPVQGLSSANSISTVGDIGSCSVISDGTLSCWGDGYVYLTQGPTNSTTPVSLPGISSVLNIQGGLKHLCALLSDNTVKCWGYNYAGQIGTGIGTGRPDTTTWWIPTPLPVVGM